MLKCTKNMAIPSVEQAISILNGNLGIRPIYIDYDKVLMNIFSLGNIIDENTREFQRLTGDSICDDDAMKYYIAKANIAGAFNLTDTGAISLDAESIETASNSPILSDYDAEVLKYFRAVKKAKKARSAVVPFLQNPLSKEISCDGHRMLEIRPEWSSQNTGRVAMSKPAIQNINRELQELITVPLGYKLIHCDSGQVEPRITYSAFVKDEQIKALINLYDDAYYGLLHYCTMDQSFIDSGTLNFEKHEITQDMKDGRKKIKTYGNAVMYGSKKEEDNIKAAMTRRIGHHPARLQLIRDIEYQLDRGRTTFYTYFGTPIDISKSPKLQESGRNTREQLIKLAINNPIQGTAADLMRYSLLQASRLIMSAKKSSIVAYVHDAGYFCIHEDEYEKIGHELEDIVAYQVDDWLPVHADAEIYKFSENGAYAKYKY